jgi:hypothetical protein
VAGHNAGGGPDAATQLSSVDRTGCPQQSDGRRVGIVRQGRKDAIEKVAASYAEIATAAQASRPLHTPGRET